MEYKSHEIKTGIVVFIGIAIFLVFLFAITKSSFQVETKTYVARFSYTNGIKTGSQVRCGGLLVGEVSRVYYPNDDNSIIEIELTVDKKTPVKTNSEAFITSIGIMGEFYIEITTGTPTASLLPEGALIQSRTVASLAQMGEPLEKVSYQLEILLMNLNELLNENNRSHLSGMIASMDTILRTAQTDAVTLVNEVSGLTTELREMTENVNNLVNKNEASIHESVLRMTGTITQAESLLVNLNLTASQINDMMDSNDASLQKTLGHIAAASRNFEDFSRKIKDQPWSLVRKSMPPSRKIK